MKRSFTSWHTRGESLFLDDLPSPEGLLHAAVFASKIPCGRISKLDIAPAQNHAGVFGVLTARDIPAENQIGSVVADEPLLATDEVHYLCQPMALVVAQDKVLARDAALAIEADFEELPGVFDPREAAQKGLLIAPPRTLQLGDVEKAWGECEVVVEGLAETGAQEHLYLETQGALAIPEERGGIKLYSSTQSPTAVQRAVSRVLGIPMNQIEVEVGRLGGAFGGKEDQATPWAVMAALAAARFKRPIKLVLSRGEDLLMTGKRHPYSSDYRIGLSSDGKILAYEANFYQNGGASADLSLAILERSLMHCTNAYFVPNVKVTGYSCRTNITPFTAFRGFGGPQAMFCIEAALSHAADEMGVNTLELQRANLLNSGDLMPFGTPVKNSTMVRSFEELERRFNLKRLYDGADSFNRSNRLHKKGVSVMPVCFGISFTSTFLNQAGALVHVYTDGTASVSTGAVEMGQGVAAKLGEIAHRVLGIPTDKIEVLNTNTTRVANTSPTAASSATDLNGKAVERACRDITGRLKKVAAEMLEVGPDAIEIVDGQVCLRDKKTSLVFEKLVAEAHRRRIDLTAHGFYATPDIYYDLKTEVGRPFAYHVFGTAAVEVTLDCLRGEYRIDRVCIVHDAGRSLDLTIDLGQVEGAVVQGLGWMTLEEVPWEGGRLSADTLSTLKIPDLNFAPKMEVYFLENADNPEAVMKSKAVGEPPLMYGIGAFFALKAAIEAFTGKATCDYRAPLTPERVFGLLHEEEAP